MEEKKSESLEKPKTETAPAAPSATEQTAPLTAGMAASSATDKEKVSKIGAGKKVLVIDDDPVSLELLKEILEKAGFAIILAKDGQEGLSKVSQGKPQLIITDVLMPTLDGFSFLKEIKKDKENSRIPTLILTTRKNMEDSFLALGADAFITKPVDTEALLTKISSLVLRK